MDRYDPLAPVPRYQQIAAIIRQRILSGQLQPDRPIPSEAGIMQEFGVARATARHAVELLREEGLVVKVPGLGTYVRKPEEWRSPG
jgi:GntR family transcriptional regulator